MVTMDAVARLALQLPEVNEGVTYGHRGWLVRKKAFAWERPLSKADLARFGPGALPDGPVLGLRVGDLAEKEAVLAAGTKGVFTISHFDGYAAVLVELNAVPKRALHELLVDAWLATAPRKLANDYAAGARHGRP